MKKLSPKQKAFCQEYAIDLNGTQAAIRAGYSKNGADVQAIRLLGNASVMAELAEIAKKRCKTSDITAQMVLDGIKDVATKEDTRDGDRLKAWELLGKYLQLFVDKKQIDLAVSVTMVSLDDV